MKTQMKSISSIAQRNVPWLILIIQVIFFSIITDNFFTSRNILNILNQNAFVVATALGVSLIMMSGAVDISIGAQMSLIGVVTGTLLTQTNLPIPLTLLIAVLMGIGMNMLTTILADKMNITQFVVSIVAMNVYTGLSFVISGGRVSDRLPDAVRMLGAGTIGPISISVIITLIFFLIMSFFLTRTYWGRYIYALGGNPEASRLAGINVFKVRLMISAICGFFVSLGTLMLIGRLGTAQSTAGPGTEFLVITGVLVGGISLRGGEGKLHGVVAGILVMSVFGNGMQLAGMGVYAQQIVRGLVMLFAIAFDFYQFNRSKKLQKKQ